MGTAGEDPFFRIYDYHVLLSSRGTGARDEEFIKSLYNDLVKRGIRTIRDDTYSGRKQLQKSVRKSRVSIIVFSKGSKWTFDEIAIILKYREIDRGVVIPIFCNINLVDAFEKACHQYIDLIQGDDECGKMRTDMILWKTNLINAADNFPRDLLNIGADGDLPCFIQSLVEVTGDILMTSREDCCSHRVETNYVLKKMSRAEKWNATEIHLTNSKLFELPQNPNCYVLVKLFLQMNSDLTEIPISFFESMPVLQVLDLSNTNIKSLPPSISSLVELREFFMRGCDLMMELPPEIGKIKNLKVLDFDGTNLLYLPEEIGWLNKLECLKVSLDRCADHHREDIIPRAMLSKLSHMKELSIDVYPDCAWWDVEVKAIINELPSLTNLETLKLYLPTVDILQQFLRLSSNIYPTLSNFRLIVGRHEQRIISHLPRDLQQNFEKLKKCLKYTNGEENIYGIAKALEHVCSLFLDRHWTIKALSAFNIDELDRLNCCLLVECSQMETIVNGGEFYHEGDIDAKPILGSLEYLSIHYMENLESIWKGPIANGSLSHLKILALHTCPKLHTIFSTGLVCNLMNLEGLIVEDCPEIKCLVSTESSRSFYFLRKLKKITLLHLPELVNIFNGLRIAPKLERMVVYNCPKLKSLSPRELSIKDMEIKGESVWWEELEWHKPDWFSGRPDYFLDVFVPLSSDDDLMDQLAEAGNSLHHFMKDCKPPSSPRWRPTTNRVSIKTKSGPNPLIVMNMNEVRKIENNWKQRTQIVEELFVASTMYTELISDDLKERIKSNSLSVRRYDNNRSLEGHREWKAIVRYLGKLSHPNLVNLVGYCSENGNRVLIHEHMTRGSVALNLFPWFKSDAALNLQRTGFKSDATLQQPGFKSDAALQQPGFRYDAALNLKPPGFKSDAALQQPGFKSDAALQQPGGTFLSWPIRVKIAIGAAKGLAFLHGAEKPIIFGIFNCDTILLDMDYNAKISELIFDVILEEVGLISDPYAMSYRQLKASWNNEPENSKRGNLSCKSDVYCYGVFLLQLLTGRLLIDIPERNYADWVLEFLRDEGNLKLFVDRGLQGNYAVEGFKKLANIAYICLNNDPEARPTMQDVVRLVSFVRKGGRDVRPEARLGEGR